jgi:hypothetical protein
MVFDHPLVALDRGVGLDQHCAPGAPQLVVSGLAERPLGLFGRLRAIVFVFHFAASVGVRVKTKIVPARKHSGSWPQLEQPRNGSSSVSSSRSGSSPSRSFDALAVVHARLVLVSLRF